jgi:DNA primase
LTDFERIKDTLDLLSVITQETGLSMKGPHLESCPFCGHHDCFSIYENNRKYKCWSCESTGDVFNFIEEYRQVERSESLKIAADMAHIELSDKRESARPREKAESLQEQIYRLAAEYYHDAMLGDSAAQEWFIGKRGHKLDTLKKMRVGYSTNGLLAFLQEVGIPATDVVKYGLAKDKDKEERKIEPKDYFWKGLVIFPVSDHTGKVLSFTCKDPQKKYRGLMLENVKKSWFLNHAVLGKTHEAFLVEGQNDEASLRDVGVQNVLGTAGAPSQEQMTLLKNFYSGKTLYLWFDLDEQENYKKYTGGAHHIKFICTALRESDVTLRIIIHPGNAKDPDEFIQGLLRDRKTAVEIRTILRSMKEDALDPLAWELHLLKQIPEVKERLEAFKLRKLPQALNAIASTADQEVYLDMAAKAIGISVKAVEELVNNAADLYKNISDMFGGEAGIKKADPLRLAEHIFRWFNNGAGAKFFKTKDGKVWLFYSRKIYEIDNNLDFNTLMLQLTRLAAVEKPGSTVWYFLRTLCNAHGEPVDMMSWMHTDRERDTIYLNLNSAHNKIVRIAPAEDPRVIDNGTNEQSVLLALSPQIRQFEYLQTGSEAEGFAALKHLLMDTTPCDGPQKYFMVCWMISTFMMHYQSDRGLLQVIASSKIGKSKVAERISQLFYGESYVGKGTGAAETRVATSNPILFLDNLENRNLTLGTVDFLLLLANSSHKPKAKSGSDSEVLYQKLFTMAVITSIEAFPGKIPELVNRTFPLMLEPRYKLDGYMHDEIMREISKKRNLILSAIMKTIGKMVLPRLSERTDWSKYLQMKHAGHDKDRNNEHICTMLIILEAILEYIPWKKDTPVKTQAAELLDRWVSYWNEQESQTAISSNTLLTLMDGLVKEVCVKIRGKGKDLYYQDHPEFHAPYPNYCSEPAGEGREVKIYDDPEYLQTFFLTEPHEEPGENEDTFLESLQRVEFIVTSAELFTLFNRYCANQHIRNPFDNPTSLGSRIGNDKAIMKKGGWEYIRFKNDRQQYKKIGGHWSWRFSKKIRAMD